ncbi:MAG: hypothetical protein H6611_09705 [Ignavibacteriales bacterium]|nr:hypothetical protein [Ignavibacteriales bacterium]
MKIFTPRDLEKKESSFAFGTMSKTYWDFALLMEKQATLEYDSESKPIRSFFVFPAIIFFCATFEALLNEGISIELLDDHEDKEDLEKIKDGIGEFRSIIPRIKASAKILDGDCIGEFDENILQEYNALTELRNAIIHYNSHFDGIFQWSSKLISSFERSKVEALEGDWTETFRKKEVLVWAKETSSRIIKVFLEFQRMDENDFFGT